MKAIIQYSSIFVNLYQQNIILMQINITKLRNARTSNGWGNNIPICVSRVPAGVSREDEYIYGKCGNS